ncbi:MAG: hypothetical protein ACTSQV_07125 [Alphaproteobacteria bacterium]
MQTNTDAFFDHRLWRPILDCGNAAFSELVSGASIGLMPQRVAQRERGPMLVWRAADGIARRTFDGFAGCEVDMVLVVDDDAVARLRDCGAEDNVSELRRLVRRGHIVLYFLKCEGALIEAGFEPFLDSLGLTIMGACR